MIENIKQTKDAQGPDCDEMNEVAKYERVCDHKNEVSTLVCVSLHTCVRKCKTALINIRMTGSVVFFNSEVQMLKIKIHDMSTEFSYCY